MPIPPPKTAPVVDLTALQGYLGTHKSPADYQSGLDSDNVEQWKGDVSAKLHWLHYCQTVRTFCWAGGQGDKITLGLSRYYAYRWIEYLLDDESTRRAFVLQRDLPGVDGLLYDPATRRPAPYSKGPTWAGVLPWLGEKRTRLTVPELELALALFEWDKEQATLVWWAQQDQFPYILPSVERFLERRYAFDLAKSLRRARFGRRRERLLQGLVSHSRPALLSAVGLLAVLSTSPLFEDLIVEGSVGSVLLIGGGALIGLGGMLRANVGRMNGFLLAGRRAEKWRRALRAAGRFVGAGLTIALLFGAVWDLLGSGNLIERLSCRSAWPSGEWLARLLALGSLASFTGALVQWIWEDRSPTEPVFEE